MTATPPQALKLCPRCETYHPTPWYHASDCIRCWRELAPYGRPALPHAIYCRECRRELEGLPPEEQPPPLFTQWTRIGDSWFSPSVTDKREPYHRIDYLEGKLYCTCIRWSMAKKCQHVNRALEEIA